MQGGSIIPFCEVKNYIGEKEDNIIILEIYPKQDASFVLYEDDGETFDFERGLFSKIYINYSESKKKINIYKREGDYLPVTKRDYRIVLYEHISEKSRITANAQDVDNVEILDDRLTFVLKNYSLDENIEITIK